MLYIRFASLSPLLLLLCCLFLLPSPSLPLKLKHADFDIVWLLCAISVHTTSFLALVYGMILDFVIVVVGKSQFSTQTIFCKTVTYGPFLCSESPVILFLLLLLSTTAYHLLIHEGNKILASSFNHTFTTQLTYSFIEKKLYSQFTY